MKKRPGLDHKKPVAVPITLALDREPINLALKGAAIARWICLHLPSCHPGFNFQVCHLRLIIYSQICAKLFHAM